ncbi:hypothetical protein [Miniphocaeibacter halophilus]|uniref:Uncharacterized protein n=1 Tax=Miniphocaeibacter halophilus TaxID=2931922 RepID=A0AC61MTB0_9FIRM|nr:hypothetical protein [Miniphocaeibacter halophilus]QQK07466.1 hypothetical protein JFY71_09205 [Miniphocaeibacter halophilus]
MFIVNDFEPKKIFNMDLCKKIELLENDNLYSLIIYFLDGTTETIAESNNEKEISKKFDKIVSASGDLLSTRTIRFSK